MANANQTQTTCNTCTQDVKRPFRSYDSQGKIVSGCIDTSHTAYLEEIISSTNQWHFRPVAVKMRQRTARNLKALLKQQTRLEKGLALKRSDDLWNARYPA